MKKYFLYAILILISTSCYKTDHDRRTIRIEIDYQKGYVWDSETHIRQPFTASHFGGFLADRKLTLYSDIYQFEPATVRLPDCELDAYRATNFNNPSQTILEPSNVIEIAIGSNCFGKTFGTTFTIEVEIFIPLQCI